MGHSPNSEAVECHDQSRKTLHPCRFICKVIKFIVQRLAASGLLLLQGMKLLRKSERSNDGRRELSLFRMSISKLLHPGVDVRRHLTCEGLVFLLDAQSIFSPQNVDANRLGLI